MSGGTDAIRKPSVRAGAVVAIAIAVGLAAWAIIEGRGNDSPSSSNSSGPVVLSYQGLTELAGAARQPIYWVGPRVGIHYELQQLSDGRVFVRYLPADVDAGDPGKHLTLGTYPKVDAFEVTRTLARSAPIALRDGGVAYAGGQDATSVYAAFPGSDRQIEVYDPTPGVARALVERGALSRVPVDAPREAREVSSDELAELSASLGQAIYWAGASDDLAYEVSQDASGAIFVRYLPEGVKVGDPGTLTTVATYPLDGAFARTKAVGAKPGMETIKLAGGGIAVFPRSAGATHGYVAFPDVEYQVEVFDPKPGAARELVLSGRIVPVG